MDKSFVLQTAGVLILLTATSLCKTCVKRNNCLCDFDDGSGSIDLNSIKKTDGPMFLDQKAAKDSYMYSYNPCGAFTESTCVNVAACQFEPKWITYYDIGSPDKVTFDYNGQNVVAKYESSDGVRKSQVTLVCDPSATKPTLDVFGETQTTLYEFTLRAAAACVVSGSGHASITVSLSISIGSILIIMFFAFLLVYVVAGVAYNKGVRKATGKELLPNYGFWTNVPGLIKDGGLFCKGLVTGRRATYSQVK